MNDTSWSPEIIFHIWCWHSNEQIQFDFWFLPFIKLSKLLLSNKVYRQATQSLFLKFPFECFFFLSNEAVFFQSVCFFSLHDYISTSQLVPHVEVNNNLNRKSAVTLKAHKCYKDCCSAVFDGWTEIKQLIKLANQMKEWSGTRLIRLRVWAN